MRVFASTVTLYNGRVFESVILRIGSFNTTRRENDAQTEDQGKAEDQAAGFRELILYRSIH